MTNKEFIALLTIELMKMGFKASISHNKDMVSFEDSKQYKVYLTDKVTHITVHGYKVSRNAFKNMKIENPYGYIVTNTALTIAKAYKLQYADNFV